MHPNALRWLATPTRHDTPIDTTAASRAMARIRREVGNTLAKWRAWGFARATIRPEVWEREVGQFRRQHSALARLSGGRV